MICRLFGAEVRGVMALEELVDTLMEHAFFAPFSRDALRLVAFSAKPIRLRTGEALFRQGEAAGRAFLLQSGVIGLWFSSAREPDERVGAGVMIGERALLSQGKRPATALALEPCRLMVLEQAAVRRVLDDHPEIAEAMHNRMAAQLTQMLDDMARVRALLD
jgi:CRP-like cAMP-binding protein